MPSHPQARLTQQLQSWLGNWSKMVCSGDIYIGVFNQENFPLLCKTRGRFDVTRPSMEATWLTWRLWYFLWVPLYKARQPLRLQDAHLVTRQGFSKKTAPLPTGFYLFSGCGRDCVDILKPFVFNWVFWCILLTEQKPEFLVLVLPFISCF